MTNTVWNESDKNARIEVSGANDEFIQRINDFSSGSHWGTIRATNPKTTGKYMWAYRPTTVSGTDRYDHLPGFADENQSIANEDWLGELAGGISNYKHNRNLLGNGVEQLAAVLSRGFGWTLHCIDIDNLLYWQSLLPTSGTCWEWRRDRCSQYLLHASTTGPRLYLNVIGYATGAWRTTRSTSRRKTGTGKITWQVIYTGSGGGQFRVGVAPVGNVSNDDGAQVGLGGNLGISYLASTGVVYCNGSSVATVSAASVSDVIQVVFNPDNGDFWVRTNTNNWNGSGTADPETDTNPLNMNSLGGGSAGPYEAIASIYDNSEITASFHVDDFTVSAPTGIPAWDDENHPIEWNNGTGDPGAGTGGVDISYMVGSDFYPAASLLRYPDVGEANFGAEAFPLPSGSFPTGFDSWDPGSNPAGEVDSLLRETMYELQSSTRGGLITGVKRATLVDGINSMRFARGARETLYTGYPVNYVRNVFEPVNMLGVPNYTIHNNVVKFLPVNLLGVPRFDIATTVVADSHIPRDPKEWIPYRPTIPYVPDVDNVFGTPEADAHMKTLQAQLREEHVRLHTGGTDQPWEYLEIMDDYQRYIPGSRGRFKHDDYGLLHAVYCQFEEMNGEALGGPVGYYYTNEDFAWKVTNDITKSSSVRGFGLLVQPWIPANGQYGWVLVEGTNLYPLSIKSGEVITPDQEVTWSADGEVSATVLGGSVGRHVIPENRDSGSGYGSAELVLFQQGSGTTALNAALEAGLASVTDAAGALSDAARADALAAVAVLQESQDAQDVSIAALNTRVTNLNATVASLTNVRTELLALIETNADDVSALSAAVDSLNTALAALTTALAETLTLITAGNADSAAALAAAVAAIDAQVAGVNASIASVANEVLAQRQMHPANLILPSAATIYSASGNLFDSGQVALASLGFFPDSDGAFSEALSFAADVKSVNANDTMFIRMEFYDTTPTLLETHDSPWVASDSWRDAALNGVAIPDDAVYVQLYVINYGEEDPDTEVPALNDGAYTRKIRANLGPYAAPFVVPAVAIHMPTTLGDDPPTFVTVDGELVYTQVSP